MNKYLVLSGFLVSFSTAALAAAPVAEVTLPALPDWARDGLYDGTYLDIEKVMKEEGLSRFAAIELQNGFKDRLDGGATSRQAAYDEALADASAGRFESGWKPVQFTQPGDFVTVLDLDETLVHQWYTSGATGNFDLDGLFRDNNGREGKRSPGYVKFTPGTEQFIRALEANPRSKGVVIFSAKLDAAAMDLLARWRFSDGSLARSHFAGVFTRNHLVVGAKMLVPSKDLRIVDETVQHVVMVDDNPARVAQPQILRAQPKFDADARFRAASGSAVALHYDLLLDFALAEIEESSRAAAKLAIPFARAFLPYSYSGARVTLSMNQALRDPRAALEAVRLNPALQEAVF